MNITDIGALELETKAVNAQKYPDGVIAGKGRNSFAVDIGGTRLLDMIEAGGPGSGRHKLIWKVSDAPSGRFRSFHQRSWPTAEYENGKMAAMIHSKDGYSPKDVKTGQHAPLTVHLADHSKGTPEHPTFQWRKVSGEFKTLQEAKDAASRVLDKNPHLRPALDVKAFGTSEGVTKEWDERGRSQQAPASSTQHSEAGQFKQVVNNDKSGFTVHQSPNGSKVSVQTQTSPTGPNVAKVTHVSHTGNTSKHSGTHSQMHALVKSKFGIAHKGLQKGAQAHGKSFAHAGKQAVQKTSTIKKAVEKGKLEKSSKRDTKLKRSKDNWFDRGVVVK